MEQARQTNIQLVESEDEQQDTEPKEKPVLEQRLPSSGVIRKHSTLNGTSLTTPQLTDSHGNPNPAPVCEVIKVKEELTISDEEAPSISDEEATPKQASAYQHEVKGRLVIRAAI